MKKNWRRFLSVLLAAVMVVTAYHVPARAAGSDKMKNEFEGERKAGIEQDGSYLNVPKLGDQEDDAEEVEPVDLNEVLRVSIILDKPGTIASGYAMENIAQNSSAKAYRKSLEAEQNALIAKIQQVTGKSLDVKWQITLAANIISANVTRGDMIKIAGISGVKKVVEETLYEAPVTEPNTSNSTGMIGADTGAWANGYYGAGSRIMIIDTGTNYDHISFDPEAFVYALTKDGKSLEDYDLLTKEDVLAVADQLHRGIDPEKAYLNEKIPFAYNYIDNNYNTNNIPGNSEHGSHVAGIAAANRYVKQNGEFVDAAESVLAVGVAPDAQILTGKVFGDGGGAYDSDYFVAIEDAIILGCDAVNLSLGSAVVGFSFSDDYQSIMDSLVENGLIMVNSAGNSYAFNNGLGGNYANTNYPYNYIEDVNLATGGSPGTFTNTISVASAENVGMTGTPLVYNGDKVVFYNETSGYGNPAISTIAGTYEYVFIFGTSLSSINANTISTGAAEEYAAVEAALQENGDSLKGKIVMVFRGGISFYVKGNNAIDYEPAAVVIVNNQSGTINMNLTGFTGEFPMVSITLDNGFDVANGASGLAQAGDYYYFTGKVEVKDEYMSAQVTDEVTMSDFSSWGGNGSLQIKPEITAPGGNIYSVNGFTDDGYEIMSGTSMAAPHMTGMMALFGEYYRNELKEKVDAAFPDKEFSERQLAHSLLMSTAVPLYEYDSYYDEYVYYPIQRQGSGLANIGNALIASSFIMMEEDATASYKDGKVKAELGQSKEGKYSYSFTIYNPSKYDLLYDLSTDLFTQNLTGDGTYTYLDYLTTGMPGDVSYSFPLSTDVHDVDKDGDTDVFDAQAILDYLTGERAEEDCNLKAADLDKDDEITSLDAHLLLQFIEDNTEDGESNILVPAGESKTVNVSIDVSDWAMYLGYFTSGMWVEGYTYVTCKNLSDDGAFLEVEHSIPLQGFFGSFTDGSMFDANSLIDALYGDETPTYGNDKYTNYMLVRYNNDKKSTYYTVNPYMVEDSFPAERLAINSKSTITGFHYDLIRAAGTTGLLVLGADENGEQTEDILQLAMDNAQYPIFFHVNNSRWVYDYGRTTKSVDVNAADLGLEEGDYFYVGWFAVPEYYAMKLNGSTGGTLTEEQFRDLLFSEDDKLALGDGITYGYTLKVDDTRPVIGLPELEDGICTVSFSDNEYVAYVAIMDPSCSVVYDEFVPEQTEAGEELTYSFDTAPYAELNAITIFVADYAGNESAFVVRLGEGPIHAIGLDTIFVPAETFEAGKQYVIADSNVAGDTNTLFTESTFDYAGNLDAVIEEGEFDEYEGLYIPSEYVYEESLWTADFKWSGSVIDDMTGLEGSFVLYCLLDDDPVYLFNHPSAGLLTVNGDAIMQVFETDYVPLTSYMIWTYDDEQLGNMYGGYAAWIADAGYFDMSDEDAKLYLYEPLEVTSIVEYDPYSVSSITLDQTSVTLIPSIGIDSVQLTVDVQPITAEDRSVTWASSDETVATVDDDGLVTATGLGVATITATANDGSGVFAKAVINVVENSPMDAKVTGQVGKTDGTVEFVEIDLNNMSMETLHVADKIKGYPFYGGGRGGNLIWGNDKDDDLHIFDLSNDFAYEYLFAMNSDYAMRDGANFPLTDVNGTVLQMASVTNAAYFAMMSYEGKISYFDLLSYGFDLVAITYIGTEDVDTDEDEEPDTTYYYYYTLDSDGVLYLWYLYQTEQGWSGDLIELGKLSGIAMGEDKTAFSLSYAAAATGLDALFLADNNNKAIWFIDLSDVELDPDAEEHDPIPATYVGSIDGIVSISTLYDDVFDADGDAGIPEAVKDRISAVGAGQPLDVKTVTLVEKAAPVEEPLELPTEEVTEAPEEVTEAPEEAEEPAEEVTEAPEEEAEEPAEEVTEAPEEEAEEPAEEVTEAPEEEAEEPAEEETETPEEEAEEPAEEVTEAPEEEAEEPAEEVTEAPEEEEEPAFGGLNAVTATSEDADIRLEKIDLPDGVSPSTSPKSVFMTIAEDMDVTNGIITFTYDPEKLAFVGITEPVKAGADLGDLFSSIAVDEEAGVITFAYASKDAVEAGETLVEIEFVVCESGELLITTSERNEELDLEEEAAMEFEGRGHNWSFEGFTWTGNDEEGYTAAEASFICRNDDSHQATLEAEITVETVEATSTSTGLIIYTATVSAEDSLDGKEHSESKEVVTSSFEASFELDKDSVTIPVDSGEQLTLVGSDGSVGFGTWTSSDEKIATVDEEGYVTALKYGKATIHVVMENGYEADCEVQTLFSDVTNSKKYYYKAVYWAADHKPAITQGYDGKYFGVGQACERKDFILFLYRQMGQPKVTDAEVEEIKATFSDLPDSGLSKTFLKAIAWGYKTGVIKGYTSGELKGQFGYSRTITRREAILMIWRAAGKPEATETDLFKSFTDVVGTYKASTDTYKSIMWSVEKGISKGYIDQVSLPDETEYVAPCFGCDLDCKREDLILFLYRMDQLN